MVSHGSARVILLVYFVHSAATATVPCVCDDSFDPAVRARTSLPLRITQGTPIRGHSLTPMTATVVDVRHTAHGRGKGGFSVSVIVCLRSLQLRQDLSGRWGRC